MSKPTPVSDWAPKAEVEELPSGKFARLRSKLNVWALVRGGVFTPEMLDAFAKAQEGSLKDPALAIRLQDAIVRAMFVDPRISPDGEKGTLHIDDLDDADVAYVIERGMGGSPDLATFRGQPGGASPGPDSEDVGVPPERVDGADAVGVPARPKPRRKAAKPPA